MVKIFIGLAFSLMGSLAPGAEKTELQEFTIFALADDAGLIKVNGMEVLSLKDFPKPKSAKVFLKKGDVICAYVSDKQKGKGGFLRLNLLSGNRVVVTASDFRYSVNPDPDWTITPDLFGWKMPMVKNDPTAVLGNTKAPDQAWCQAQDKKFERVYFKYVMP
jgi:hypothetical protein